MPIRLVCFDLGGVVIRICRSWREGCVAAGLDVRGDVEGLLASEPAWSDLHIAHQTGRVEMDAYARRLSELLRGLYSAPEVARVHRSWILGEYEGVEMIVHGLHETGFETALLSNTDAEHWDQLPRYPSVRAVRQHHASHLIAAAKPHADAYRSVERRAGCRGEEILFFDDLAPNIEGARRVGWNAVQIDPAASTAPQIRRALAEAGVVIDAPTRSNRA